MFVHIFGRELFMIHFRKFQMVSDGKFFLLARWTRSSGRILSAKFLVRNRLKTFQLHPKPYFCPEFQKKNVFPFATSRDDFLFHVIRVIHSNKKFERNGCFFLISLIIIGLKIYVFPMFINSNVWLFFFLIHNRFQSIGSIKIYKKNLNNQSSTFP